MEYGSQGKQSENIVGLILTPSLPRLCFGILCPREYYFMFQDFKRILELFSFGIQFSMNQKCIMNEIIKYHQVVQKYLEIHS